jgi:hypothetical protein
MKNIIQRMTFMRIDTRLSENHRLNHSFLLFLYQNQSTQIIIHIMNNNTIMPNIRSIEFQYVSCFSIKKIRNFESDHSPF